MTLYLIQKISNGLKPKLRNETRSYRLRIASFIEKFRTMKNESFDHSGRFEEQKAPRDLSYSEKTFANILAPNPRSRERFYMPSINLLNHKNLRSNERKNGKVRNINAELVKNRSMISSPLKISKISHSPERQNNEYSQGKCYWLSMSEAVKRNNLEDSIISSFANDYIQGSLRQRREVREDSQPGKSSKLWKEKRRSVIHRNIKVNSQHVSRDEDYCIPEKSIHHTASKITNKISLPIEIPLNILKETQTLSLQGCLREKEKIVYPKNLQQDGISESSNEDDPQLIYSKNPLYNPQESTNKSMNESIKVHLRYKPNVISENIHKVSHPELFNQYRKNNRRYSIDSMLVRSRIGKESSPSVRIDLPKVERKLFPPQSVNSKEIHSDTKNKAPIDIFHQSRRILKVHLKKIEFDKKTIVKSNLSYLANTHYQN
ncbi:unnamed protein product [Moneuplotes crassus]|uniref:Uncharacterized protein n=1 Tax=Euplotes crassus TaxID=5936 RepID=A0AAD1UGH5_EUPCR|nr:unnamed protein product [Moneuplotes crassus]